MLITNIMVKGLMNKQQFILFCTLSILSFGIAFTSFSDQVFAQLLPSLSNDEAGFGFTDALKNQTSQVSNNSMNLLDQANNALKNSPLNIIDQANNALKDKTGQTSNNSTGPIDQAAIKKLENIYSLTNTVGISMVNGIKVNEIVVGENNVTATLNYQATQNDTGESPLPVTVIVTKLPVENLTKLVIFAAESSKMASTLSSGSGSVESLIEKTKLTPDTLNLALNSLDLIKNLQSGVASMTLSSLDNSQGITVQTSGGFASSFSTAPNEFVTVMVVPSMGMEPLPPNIPSIFSK